MKNKIPKLRFKEFTEEWEEKTLGEITKNISNKNKENKNLPVYSINNKIGFIPQSEQFDGVDSKERGYDTSLYKIVSQNTFVYNPARINVGSIGYSYDLENILVSSLYTCFKTNNVINDNLLFQYLKTYKFLKAVRRNVEGGVRDYLFYNNFSNIKYLFSSLPEQEKIANFLSSVDTKIEMLEKKKELLSNYKKGMMQKLFSQKLRFKDENGNYYPKWEEKKLGEIVSINMGQSPNSESYNEDKEGLPLIQGNADINKRKTVPRNYTSSPTKVCDINDIIMTVRAPVGYIAKSYHIACIGRGVCAIKGNDYIYQYLLNYEDKWEKYSQGSTFTAVNSSDIRNLILTIPSFQEQEKIANFLSSIDKKIDLLEGELEKNREFKKGLLQQMFV